MSNYDITNPPAAAADFTTTNNKIDVVGANVDTLVTALEGDYPAGKPFTFETTDTETANGGDTTLATATGQDCYIHGVGVYAASAQPAHMTEIAIVAGPGKVQTLIPVADLQQTDVNAEGKSVFVDLGRPGYLLKVGETIKAEHTGGGADPLDLEISVAFEPTANGGYLV